jgi:hypothetical protein
MPLTLSRTIGFVARSSGTGTCRRLKIADALAYLIGR